MEICHERCLELLRDQVKEVKSHSFVRALDVAAGDGRLAKSGLFKHYQEFDMFDQCTLACQEARNAMQNVENCRLIEQTTMQQFMWPSQYSAIYMVWCTGYLGDEELASFL